MQSQVGSSLRRNTKGPAPCAGPFKHLSTRRPQPAFRTSYTTAPWHFLYFFPEPHGQGALRGTLSLITWLGCLPCGAAAASSPPLSTAARLSETRCGWACCASGRTNSTR